MCGLSKPIAVLLYRTESHSISGSYSISQADLCHNMLASGHLTLRIRIDSEEHGPGFISSLLNIHMTRLMNT